MCLMVNAIAYIITEDEIKWEHFLKGMSMLLKKGNSILLLGEKNDNNEISTSSIINSI